jgi:hypothetical protein
MAHSQTSSNHRRNLGINKEQHVSEPSASLGSVSTNSTNYGSKMFKNIVVCTKHIENFFLVIP